MSKTIAFLFAAIGALLFGVTAPVHAVFIDSTTTPTVLGNKNGVFNLHFQPNVTGDLGLAFLSDQDPRRLDPTPTRFRIIDNTLLDFSFLPSSGRANNLRIRMGFSGNSIRAGLRRLGVRARDLRVLNYDSDGKRWVRVRALRRQGQIGAGVAGASSGPVPLVWAVTERSNGLFSVAALLVPEPTTLALGATGLLLLLRTRRTRPTG